MNTRGSGDEPSRPAVARFRFVDADEGAYLTDCRLLIEGRAPYVDFFFPQTPLFLYVYSGWVKIFGVTLYSARALSAVLAALTGTLLFGLLVRWTAKFSQGWLAVLLYMSNGLVCGCRPPSRPWPSPRFCPWGHSSCCSGSSWNTAGSMCWPACCWAWV